MLLLHFFLYVVFLLAHLIWFCIFKKCSPIKNSPVQFAVNFSKAKAGRLRRTLLQSLQRYFIVLKNVYPKGILFVYYFYTNKHLLVLQKVLGTYTSLDVSKSQEISVIISIAVKVTFCPTAEAPPQNPPIQQNRRNS